LIAERFIEFADVPIQLLKQEEREAKIRRKEIRSWKQSSGGRREAEVMTQEAPEAQEEGKQQRGS